MANVYVRFQRLLPREPLQIGTVAALNADGTSTVTLPSGGSVRVRGQSVAVGSKAFIRNGEVIGEAPNLSAYTMGV